MVASRTPQPAMEIGNIVISAIGGTIKNILQMFLIVPPIALITMLPISIAGWGVREATMMVAFGYAGLVSSDGTMVSLLTGVTSFLVGILGGMIWITSSEKVDHIPE